jgi:glucan phosphoethanolaminetransferase (alkaline phosphatase superfamily)
MDKFKIEIKWALIFIGAMLLWMVLERAVGLHDEHIDKQQYLTTLFAIPAIVIYVLALKDKRKNYYEGEMTYGQGFLSGLVITVIVALFSAPVQWIISTLITPNYFNNVIEYSVETGYYETREAAKANFNLSNYMLQSVIGALIMGVLTTAVVAIFTRRQATDSEGESG